MKQVYKQQFIKQHTKILMTCNATPHYTVTLLHIVLCRCSSDIAINKRCSYFRVAIQLAQQSSCAGTPG